VGQCEIRRRQCRHHQPLPRAGGRAALLLQLGIDPEQVQGLRNQVARCISIAGLPTAAIARRSTSSSRINLSWVRSAWRRSTTSTCRGISSIRTTSRYGLYRQRPGKTERLSRQGRNHGVSRPCNAVMTRTGAITAFTRTHPEDWVPALICRQPRNELPLGNTNRACRRRRGLALGNQLGGRGVQIDALQTVCPRLSGSVDRRR